VNFALTNGLGKVLLVFEPFLLDRGIPTRRSSLALPPPKPGGCRDATTGTTAPPGGGDPGRGVVSPRPGPRPAAELPDHRFLTAPDGSRGASLLKPDVYKDMTAPPPSPLKRRENGTHVGLGWDSVV
jgi:hypothetical protein